MAIPTQGFFDPPTDSVVNAQERAEKMRAEAAEQAKAKEEAEQRRLEREAQANEKARKEEDAYVAQQLSLISDVETRETLHERIRAMRADAPEPPKPPPMTERMKKQLEEEQEAGRQAVAKAQAQQDWAQQARLKAQREEAAKEGQM